MSAERKRKWPKRDWSLYDGLYSEEELALTGGRMVRKGLISVFVPDEPIPLPPMPIEPRAKLIPRRPAAKCGTTSGAARHRRHGEKVCDACLAAERNYRRTHRLAQGKLPRKTAPHGTNAAYQHHLDRGTEVCDACQEARRTYKREWARKHRAAKKAELMAEMTPIELLAIESVRHGKTESEAA